MNPNVAKCLLVSKVLVADGMMQDEEKEFLAAMMEKLGLTPDEQKRVINLEGLDAASDRLRNFVQKAAQATLVGEVFDDAATGQGLLNYFLRAINCGAITEEEALERSGLTLEELGETLTAEEKTLASGGTAENRQQSGVERRHGSPQKEGTAPLYLPMP